MGSEGGVAIFMGMLVGRVGGAVVGLAGLDGELAALSSVPRSALGVIVL